MTVWSQPCRIGGGALALGAQAPRGAGEVAMSCCSSLGPLLSSLRGCQAHLESGPGLGSPLALMLCLCEGPVWYSFLSGPQAAGTQSRQHWVAALGGVAGEAVFMKVVT